MKQKIVVLIVALVSTLFTQANISFRVNVAGELPKSFKGYQNEGFAGTFSGIIDNKLFVAGGAGFPDKKPWEGGVKVFSDQVYMYDIVDDSLLVYCNSFGLPKPVAYGASVSLSDGVLCIGGNNSDKCFSNVFLIKWDEKSQYILYEDYPGLPVPLSYASAVLLDDKVYLVGGSSSVDGTNSGNHFYCLDLSKKESLDFAWKALPSFPGKGRIFSVAVGQSNGKTSCMYLFSGRNVDENKEVTVFRDGWVYNPELEQWSSVETNDSFGFPVMAGSAFAVGSNNIAFVGGTSGELLLKENQLRKKLDEIIKLRDTAAIASYQKERLRYYLDHPGFSKDILLYNTITKTMVKTGEFESLCPVTTHIVTYKNGAFLTSGEIKPGFRTREIFLIRPVQQAFILSLLNPVLLGLIFIVMVITGYIFLKKK